MFPWNYGVEKHPKHAEISFNYAWRVTMIIRYSIVLLQISSCKVAIRLALVKVSPRFFSSLLLKTGRTDCGIGGESIYGEPFADEFHTRLRFVRRGLVAMANAGKNDNASQFFFTLDAAPELTNKHTIFGRVSLRPLANVGSCRNNALELNLIYQNHF